MILTQIKIKARKINECESRISMLKKIYLGLDKFSVTLVNGAK